MFLNKFICRDFNINLKAGDAFLPAYCALKSLENRWSSKLPRNQQLTSHFSLIFDQP